MCQLWKAKKASVMTNLLANWWRSSQFRRALQRGNERQAQRILQKIENSGAKFSWLEQLFKNKLKSEQSLYFYKRELASVSGHLKKTLGQQRNTEYKDDLLVPDTKFTQHIRNCFQFIDHDEGKLQCTGIDKRVFNDFESSLADFLKDELNKICPNKRDYELKYAIEDIDKLKDGVDPKYDKKLSPHVYLMKYFLENVYCSYLAWFLIYKAGLLPKQIKILDIAAGPGTVAYGLALLLQSSNGFFPMPPMHVSYYSLEQQALLQYRGLQFWRKYIEAKKTATNAYFRFDTTSIFHHQSNSEKLPKGFFDFIVVSHCLFYEPQQRIESHQIYKDIFKSKLATDGYVFLIVQGRKLFTIFNFSPSEDLVQEQNVIIFFLEEVELKLEWYKYITSTGKRKNMGSEFAKFAKENLPEQESINPLKYQYLKQKFPSSYAIDDYVIIARR